MNRVEAVCKAFQEAEAGVLEAFPRLAEMWETGANLAALAPVAAQIYRQLTSLMVVTFGNEKNKGRQSDLVNLKYELGNAMDKAGITAPILLGSQDLHIYYPDSELVKVIIQELVEERMEDSPEEPDPKE